MSTCKETLCTRCAHRTVCSLKEEFINAQAAVDRIDVARDDKSIMPLSQIKWIKPIELQCIHFLRLETQKYDYNLCGTSDYNRTLTGATTGTPLDY